MKRFEWDCVDYCIPNYDCISIKYLLIQLLISILLWGICFWLYNWLKAKRVEK